MIPGVIEHLSDQPSALTDVFVHYGTGHHLGKRQRGWIRRLESKQNHGCGGRAITHLEEVAIQLAGNCSGQKGFSCTWTHKRLKLFNYKLNIACK